MGGCFHCNRQSLKVCLPGRSCRAQVRGSVQSVWLQWLCGRSEVGVWQRLVFLHSCTSKRIIDFCLLTLKGMTLGAFLCLQRTSQINEKLTHLWGNHLFKSVDVMVACLSRSMDIRRTSRDTTHGNVLWMRLTRFTVPVNWKPLSAGGGLRQIVMGEFIHDRLSFQLTALRCSPCLHK